MKPTSIRLLVALAIAAFAVAFALQQMRGGAPVDVPGYAPVSLLVLAAVEGYTAQNIRARIARRPGTNPVLPLVVARTAALAKASSPVGALVAGAYGGTLLYALTAMDSNEAARDEVLTLVFGLLVSVGLAVAAVALEHACRTPALPDDDDEPPT